LRDDGEAGIAGPGASLLPELKANPDDPGAGFLLSIAAVADPARQVALLKDAVPKHSESVELPLCLAKSLIDVSSFEEAETQLAAVEARDPFDWRVAWYRGISLLARRQAREAWSAFDRVYGELPGEPAAKLAVALAAEAAGDGATAVRLYDLISRTDPTFVTASLGLARCLGAVGKRHEAAEAYRRVPPTSSLYAQAQAALARALVRTTPAPPAAEELLQASAVVEALTLEGLEQARLRTELLEIALTLLGTRAVSANPTVRVLGQPLGEIPLRRGLEQTLRQMARLVTDRDQQIALVDRANAVRPRTWI
jgi:serine/threonine-protein kinase PknG